LVACEAFDNFPPGPAEALAPLCGMPGGAWLALRAMRLSNRSRHGYGAMSLRGIPQEILGDWFAPATRDKAIRRDFAKFATSTPDRETLLAASERLRGFDRPVLVVWAAEDAMMPREHGPRLAALFPHGRLVEIAESATLIPEDQPERLAEALSTFLAETDVQPA
jgi:pimeloyl-ACP methyl ester carboxylesterase